MDLNAVKAFPVPRRRKKRVGRGAASGHGGTSTKGHKGQKARAGWGMRRPFEGGQMPLFRRLPKRGFPRGRYVVPTAVVNVERLNAFPAGATVDAAALAAAGLVTRTVKRVRILGGGALNVALTVRADGFSASARDKIEKAGGKAEVVQ